MRIVQMQKFWVCTILFISSSRSRSVVYVSHHHIPVASPLCKRHFHQSGCLLVPSSPTLKGSSMARVQLWAGWPLPLHPKSCPPSPITINFQTTNAFNRSKYFSVTMMSISLFTVHFPQYISICHLPGPLVVLLGVLRTFLWHLSSKAPIFFSDFEIVHDSHNYT